MDRYAVIGNPIEHSKSPLIHTEFARQTAQDLCYEALLAPLDGFAAAVADFRAAGGRGLNVTVPFKLEAFALATEVSERARRAQAVNTLSFDGDRIVGDNTDGVGLVRDLVLNAGFKFLGKRALLVGAGGAARGVLLPLLEQGLAELVIANRTLPKAKELARELEHADTDTRLVATSFEALFGERFDLVINATSAGMLDVAPELPDGLFEADGLAYDMMYGRPSAFLGLALAQGAAHTADGLGMLVEQAAESFFLWRGVRPATAPVLGLLREQARRR